MKTHTTRWSGSKDHRIVTFTPAFMDLLKTAKHDRVIRIVISQLLTRAHQDSGFKHTITYEQLSELEAFANTIICKSIDKYQFSLEQWIITGIEKSAGVDLVELFERLNVILPLTHKAFADRASNGT